MTIVAVILHDMPQDRLWADRHHGFRDIFGVFSDSRSETASKTTQLSLGQTALDSTWSRKDKNCGAR